jgi:hypothetical protein
VRVAIDWTPLDTDQAREMREHVWALLVAAGPGKEIGTYGYDDPGSDYGYWRKINIDFHRCRYFRTARHGDGTLLVLLDGYGADWMPQAEADALRAGAEPT